MVLHFGLGKAAAIDRLLIRWPGGLTQTWTQLTVNRKLVATEGAAQLQQVEPRRP
jgi:hypothetical protein